MTLPAPLTSSTFVDGELTNEVKWYIRVFQVINAIISYLSGLPVIQHGTATASFSGTAAATVTVTFPVAFSATPEVTCDVSPITSNTPVTWGITAVNSTGFTLFVRTVSGGSITAGLTVRWIAAN